MTDQSKATMKKLGDKLRNCRNVLDLTLADVSARVGFSNHQTLLSIEKGDREVKAFELSKLAKVYLKDYSYFLDEESVEIAEPVVCWRERQESVVTKEKEQEFLKFCDYYHMLETYTDSNKRIDLPKMKLDNISNLDPEAMALHYKKVLNLGARPGCVLRKILEEEYGIKILYMDLDDCGSAASARGVFGSAVALNICNAPWRTTFDLAHELFHIITLDHLPNINHDNLAIEKLADKFAAALLLPYDEVVPEFTKRVKDSKIEFLDIVELAKDFYVSTQAMMYRLANLKLIAYDDVLRIINNGKHMSLDKEARRGSWSKRGPFSDRYINLAFRCYSLGHISKGKLAECLNIPKPEVIAFLEGHGYSESDQNHAFAVSAPA